MKSFLLIIAITALIPNQAISSNIELEDKCNGSPVVEVVTFKVNNGVTETQLVNAANLITPDLEKTNGFKSRSLSYDKEEKWVDIVFWSGLKPALLASESMMKNETALKFFALIDQSNMSINHFCEK